MFMVNVGEYTIHGSYGYGILGIIVNQYLRIPGSLLTNQDSMEGRRCFFFFFRGSVLVVFRCVKVWGGQNGQNVV